MLEKISLQQLETFLAIIRCGGVNTAASQLHVTQPAVSVRLRTLGGKLFKRSGIGLVLTVRGELLRHYAEKFLHLVELMENELFDANRVSKRVRLGVSETIAQS